MAGLAVYAPQLIQMIPRYSKWQPALLALVLYCFNSAWASVSTPLTNTLNALGRVKTNTYLMLMWTALTWILVPYLAHRFGYNGVAYATAIIALSSIVPIIIVKRLTHFSLINSVLKPFLATLAMISVSWLLISLPLILNILISYLTFILIIYLLTGPALLADTKKILYALAGKK